RGEFELRFPVGNPNRGQKVTPDLVLTIVDPTRDGATPLQTLGPICNSPATTVLDITLSAESEASPSEYESLRATIDPTLNLMRLSLAQVQPEGLEFLACATGADLPKLTLLHATAVQVRALTTVEANAAWSLADIEAILYGVSRRSSWLSFEILL